MSFWRFITSNQILNIAIIAWFIAQLLKFVVILIEKKEFDFSRFVGSGGMPSSHTAIMVALVTTIARIYGFASPYFAISLVVTFVVVADATGVRRSAGKQAVVLNKMMDNLGNNDPDFWGEKLKELIGHTPFQVFVGGILGFVIAMIIPI